MIALATGQRGGRRRQPVGIGRRISARPDAARNVGRPSRQPAARWCGGHLYVEFDGRAIDPDRLRDAATKLAMRHPMLRVRFLSDGTQRIDPARNARASRSRCTIFGTSPRCRRERLAGLREAKSHQQLDGQVLELTLSLLPGESSRLHVDLDMQAADAMSYRTLMADLAALYQGSAAAGTALHLPGIPSGDGAAGIRAAACPRSRPGLVVAAHPRTPGPAQSCRLRAEKTFPATALDAGSGWIREPGMRCSRTPAPAVSPPR